MLKNARTDWIELERICPLVPHSSSGSSRFCYRIDDIYRVFRAFLGDPTYLCVYSRIMTRLWRLAGVEAAPADIQSYKLAHVSVDVRYHHLATLLATFQQDLCRC